MRPVLIAVIVLLSVPAAAAAHGADGSVTHRDTREELAFVDAATTARARGATAR